MTIIPHHFGSQLKAKLLHRRIRQLSRRDWRTRHHKVFERHPEYLAACPGTAEREHLSLWQPLRRDIRVDTLRVCYHLSGQANPAIIPEELFVSEVEPCLNHYPEARFLGNKSFYNRWFRSGVFPEAFLHNIEGEYFDSTYQPLLADQLPRLLAGLPYPVILKPSRESGGGYGIYFLQNSAELVEKMQGQQNFVVQEVIRQHPFLQQFNPPSLNTLRVYTYRSVVTNTVHVLNSSLRMGRGKQVDNESQGGVVCSLHDDGHFYNYAWDKLANKFERHPDTNLVFADQPQMPNFQKMKQLACEIARDVFLARLLGFDIGLDATGSWRVIEINVFGHAPRFSQYIGQPFFREFTNEVIEYCTQHPDWR